MAKEIFALVKWTKGEDAGLYTVGVPVDHIKNFDYKKFQNDEYDPAQKFVVEWRDTPKEPLGGWKVFEAAIIAVSHSRKVLEKKMNVFDGEQSPNRIATPLIKKDSQIALETPCLSKNEQYTKGPRKMDFPDEFDNEEDAEREKNEIKDYTMSKTGARKVGCKANTLGKTSIDDIADKLYEKKRAFLDTSGTPKVVENKEKSTTPLEMNSEDDYEESVAKNKENIIKVNTNAKILKLPQVKGFKEKTSSKIKLSDALGYTWSDGDEAVVNTSGTLKVVENEERSTTQLRINSEDDYEESDGEDKEKRTKVNNFNEMIEKKSAPMKRKKTMYSNDASNTDSSSDDQKYVTKKDFQTAMELLLSKMDGKTATKVKKISYSSDESDDISSSQSSKSSRSGSLKTVKKIGNDKLSIEIPYEKWRDARRKTSFTAMSWALVLILFKEEVLLTSNYQGGASKTKKDQNNQFKKLDANIIDIIKGTVRRYFKNTYNDSMFGTNLNTRLSQFRKSHA